MKIQKFEQYSVNEEALPRGTWDEGNSKAVKGWTDKSPDTEYLITTNEPINITTTDDVELSKMKMLFYKHDIKFDVKELQLK
jgi:hypothetical protein